MEIRFSVKQLTKKRPFINAQPLEITGEYNVHYSLKDILTAIVTQQVGVFNNKIEDSINNKNLFTFFEENELNAEAETGKVRFGAIYNDKKADLDKAIETVLLAFYDGLIVIFVDERQLDKLEDQIRFNKNSVVTLVRLTFLSGSFW